MDILIGKTVERNNKVYTVIEVDRTCYQPNHTADNPWIVMENYLGEKAMGCLMTIAPELAE
jgi:hypothetical protein